MRPSSSGAAEWPQLQHDAARTGFTSDSVAPPYRARWTWFGEEGTLRNRASKPGDPRWTDALEKGKDFPMPRSVSFSFAGSMQPIARAGRVFVADCQGAVHALRLEDGETLWRAALPGGSLHSGVASATTSFVSGHETIDALNDGFTPAHSDDKSHGAYGNWPRSGTQWVEYEWKRPISTARVEVYWFDDRRGVRLPKACRLEAWEDPPSCPSPGRSASASKRIVSTSRASRR
jgi:hypothetical protein